MCDRWSENCQTCWMKQFYHQYLEQHSAMTQWFHHGFQISQSYGDGGYVPTAEDPSSLVPPAEHFNTLVSNQIDQTQSQWIGCSEPVPMYQSNTNPFAGQLSSNADESSSDESDVSRDDIIGSDDEIYFDPGCFLSMDSDSDKDSLSEKSDENSDSDKDSEEEFEIVDSVVQEFEYVQLDKFGNMSENRKGRKGRPHAAKEMKIEKEIREYLYGGKADTIAGLETAMSLDFNRLCDLYQPHLWPVLPVRLSKV